MNDDEVRLSYMFEAIGRARAFIKPGRQRFLKDVRTQEAVAFEVLKVGDSASNMTQRFRKTHRDVPWVRLVQLRDLLIHEHFRPSPEALWETVSKEMAGLERKLLNISRSRR